MKRIKARVVKKRSFFGRVWDLFSNKKDTKGAFTRGALALLVTFYAVSIIGMLFITLELCFLYSGIAEKAIGEISLHVKLIMSIVALLVFLYMLIIYKAAGEVEKEKDKNYIVALFSGVTSFAALIVAIASLFVGVR